MIAEKRGQDEVFGRTITMDANTFWEGTAGCTRYILSGDVSPIPHYMIVPASICHRALKMYVLLAI